MATPWWIFGALSGASSVAFGAFGAHGLKGRGIAPEKIASWQTAAHYQVSHRLFLRISCLDGIFFHHLERLRADVFLSIAYPLRRNPRSRTSRSKECLGKGTLHRGNYWFLGIDLCFGSE